MNIKVKLLLSTALLVVSMLLMLGLQMYSLKTMHNLLEGIEAADAIDKGVLQLRRNEKDFLARKDEKYIGKFQKNVSVIKAHSADLKRTFKDFDLSVSNITQFDDILSQYQRTFERLNQQQKEIGYKTELGLQGSLMIAYKAIREEVGQNDHKALAELYQLRAIEKQFMLQPADSALNEMADAIANSSQLSAIASNLLADYDRAFNAIYESKKEDSDLSLGS